MSRTLIVIPARMSATRLPGKPMVDIAGVPMIAHVWRRAVQSEAGRVVVAADTVEIVEAVRAAGGEALLTRPDHASGSDRIYEAVTQLDPEGLADFIVNLQGDLPTLEPHLVRACLAPLAARGPDIGTLAAEIVQPEERMNPNVVKVVGTPIATPSGPGRRLRALYFTRATAPYGEGPLYHHIGIYAYRRAALQRFIGLAPSTLERREKLEQLRALEAGMRIDVEVVDTVPLGVDTPADLERARRLLGHVSSPAT